MVLIDEVLLKNSYIDRNIHKNALFLLKNCPAKKNSLRPLLPAA